MLVLNDQYDSNNGRLSYHYIVEHSRFFSPTLDLTGHGDATHANAPGGFAALWIELIGMYSFSVMRERDRL